jgi:hypothetical protein
MKRKIVWKSNASLGVLAAILFAGLFLGCASTETPETISGAERNSLLPGDWIGAGVVYTVPEMTDVRVAGLEYKEGFFAELYYPRDNDFSEPKPAVIFVTGYTNEQTIGWFGCKLKDMGQYVTWAELVASNEMVGITYETDYPADDFERLMEFLTAYSGRLGIDVSRIGLFACSANSPEALHVMTDKGSPYAQSIRCGVLYYPILGRFIGMDAPVAPALKRRLRKDLPLQIVEVPEEDPSWNEGVGFLIDQGRSEGVPLEHVYLENAFHGFDTALDTEQARDTIRSTIDFFRINLKE